MPATSAADRPAQRIIQRMVLPLDPTPDIVPLYVEQHAAFSQGSGSFGLGTANAETKTAEETSARADRAITQVDVDELSDRRSLALPGRSMRSFGTYFNAFPASYWRRWTPVRTVTLQVSTVGEGRVVVYRSNARGSLQRQAHETVNGRTTSTFELPLDAFGDGGWYWFDVYAGAEGITVASATWSADAALARENGTLSLSMTTMNKVSYCLDNIRTVLENREIMSFLDTMYVIDQGSDRLRDHAEELAPLQQAMGDQLEIIEQGNIGGSGGFSRGMYEAATRERPGGGTSTYVVNCDDDIVIEPESLVRLKTFADYATKPTLVGAHMFDLNNRSTLHTFGEVVDPWRIQPALPDADASLSHDLAQQPLRSTDWLHRRTDVDYNGWWMCLIPTDVVREIGLSLPVFIKWDDAEYGLRAKAAGYRTVSLPGAGVWHVSWADKDDLVGWQAFYHERNRIITALLHSPYARGGRVIKESQFMDVKHVISMQYYTEQGRLMAQQSVLRGPHALHGEIGTTLPQIRKMAADFPDAQYRDEPDEFPEVRVHKPPRKGRPFSQPHPLALPAWTAKTLAKQLVKPARGDSRENPQSAVPHAQAKWWRLSAYDSALVSNAEGTKVAWFQRDPRAVRTMLREAIGTHAEMWRRWPELQRTYREALGEITSFGAWEKTFAQNPAPARPGDARSESSTPSARSSAGTEGGASA